VIGRYQRSIPSHFKSTTTTHSCSLSTIRYMNFHISCKHDTRDNYSPIFFITVFFLITEAKLGTETKTTDFTKRTNKNTRTQLLEDFQTHRSFCVNNSCKNIKLEHRWVETSIPQVTSLTVLMCCKSSYFKKKFFLGNLSALTKPKLQITFSHSNKISTTATKSKTKLRKCHL
jgi:hypothetical protein